MTIRGGKIVTIERFSKPINEAVGTLEIALFDLSVVGIKYNLESFIFQFPNPSANVLTLNLYTLINDVESLYDSFIVDSNNYNIVRTMMDMFGLSNLESKLIKLKAVSTGGTYTITGQYGYSETI